MTLASLREAFREAHVGLVTQQANCCGSVVPSKVYTVMAAGRPVLFIGPRNATPARIVEQFRCGWQIDPGDVNSLRRLLDILIRNPSQVREAGEAARRAFNSNYDRPLGVARICSIFEAVLASPAVSRRKPVLT
jgi:glycosyltransferase involved in cell wall biosynthesis